MNKQLIDELKRDGTLEVKCQEPLCKHTAFKIGGPAEIFVQVDSLEGLRRVFGLGLKFNLPIFILGKGSNLLVSDEGVKGVVITLGPGFEKIIGVEGQKVTCGAAITWKKLILELAGRGIGGLEFGWGIPGTLGGALINNAGSKTKGVLDLVEEVKFINFQGVEKTLKKEEIKKGYRFSSLREEGGVVVSVVVRGRRREGGQTKKELERLFKKRKESQPLDLPSAGSVFKNPEGYAAAKLIEESGAKGLRCGGVVISEKHANFIVNAGKGSAREVLALIEEVKKRVKNKQNIDLELELELVGF